MMYINRTITLVISIFLSYVACAEPIDSVQAERIASTYVNRSSAAKSANKAMQHTTLRLAKKSKGYFAYNVGKEEGFVLVASDDSYPAQVLAFSDEGCFDADNMPENVKWWLSQYDEEMKIIREHPEQIQKAAAKSRADIPYMVTTKWGQSAPYYNMCPTQTNSSGQQQHCITGCSATALAQVINYHKWPERGSGTSANGYSYNHAYDWANMKDTYVYYYDENYTYHSATYNTTEANAVAQLMRDCGNLCDVAYGLGETGGRPSHAKYDLIHNLGYSADIRVLNRSLYTNEELLNIIYEELANRRPILWSGGSDSNPKSAHAFLCDGYKDGCIHMNWGWNGQNDGYYYLGNFPPSADYNRKNDGIIVGIEPAKSIQTYVACLETSLISFSSTTDGMSITLSGFQNSGNRKEEGLLGVKVVSEDGDILYYASTTSISIAAGQSATTLKKIISFKYADIIPTDGLYKIYPAYKNQEGDWYDIHWTKYSINEIVNVYPFMECIVAEKNGSNVTLTRKGLSSNLSATINGVKQFQVGNTVTLTGKVTATDGDYNSYIMAAYVFENIGTKAIFDNPDRYIVKLEKGAQTTFSIDLPAKDAIGSYNVAIFDNNYVLISDITPIEIVEELQKGLVAEAPFIQNRNAATKDDKIIAKVMPINRTVEYSRIQYYVYNEDEEDMSKYAWNRYKTSSEVLPENVYTSYEIGAARARGTAMSDGTIYKGAFFDFYYGDRISDFTYYRTAGDKSITFTMSSAGWSTLMLPFNAQIPDGLTFYEIDGNQGSKLEISPASSIMANTPYLVNGVQGVYTFSGTPTGDVMPSYTKGVLTGAMYTHKVSGDNMYVLQKKAQSGLGFYRIGAEEMKIPIYRCYLTAEPGTNVSFFPLDIVTCIDKTDANVDKKTTIFNTMGVRMNGDNLKMMPKGVYIVNGKKVVVK